MSIARRLAVLLLAALALTGCSGSETSSDEGVRTITAREAQRLIEEGAVVIDVRTSEEFGAGHLAQARNIDVQSNSFRAAVDELDRDATYVVYCRSGARAGVAAETMLEMGFADVANAGGFEDLADAGLPTAGG